MQLLEQLAHRISNEAPGAALAALQDNEEIFYSIHSYGEGVAESAITRLTQGIHDHHADRAWSLLRRRIHCTYPLGEMCFGMAKVCAKRLGPTPLVARDHGLNVSAARAVIPLARALAAPPSFRATDDAGWLAHARALAATAPRAIAALLVAADGTLLAQATHAGSGNPSLHAEVCLLQGFLTAGRRTVPAGARIFTTLKPCKMCAGMIWETAENPARIDVIYGEPDPGPKASQTVLDAGTFERRRAIDSGSTVPLGLQLERLAPS